MLYEIKIRIKNYAEIKVYTNYETTKNKLIDKNSAIRRTIPITDVSISNVKNDEICYHNSIIMINNENKKMHYDKKYNVSILNVSESEIRFMDLVYIMLSMFSKILSEQKKYLLHSSALLHPSNEAFVLVGDANAGKTSLAYELMSKHNCKLISNDHSIIGMENNKPMILGGTKEIQMRLGATELYFPDLYDKINIETDDKWNKKIVVNEFVVSNLILKSDNDKAQLTNVFSINTTNFGESFLRKKDKIDQFLFLYESMSRIIKGTYNYITGFDYPMPSMENEKSLNDLSELCKFIVEKCDVYDAKGSINGLAKVLVKKYEK